MSGDSKQLDKANEEILRGPYRTYEDYDGHLHIIDRDGRIVLTDSFAYDKDQDARDDRMDAISDAMSAKARSSQPREELLRQLVLDCINDLGTYLVPDSGISEHDVVNTLLGRLDGPQARAALSADTAKPRAMCIRGGYCKFEPPCAGVCQDTETRTVPPTTTRVDIEHLIDWLDVRGLASRMVRDGYTWRQALRDYAESAPSASGLKELGRLALEVRRRQADGFSKGEWTEAVKACEAAADALLHPVDITPRSE